MIKVLSPVESGHLPQSVQSGTRYNVIGGGVLEESCGLLLHGDGCGDGCSWLLGGGCKLWGGKGLMLHRPRSG